MSGEPTRDWMVPIVADAEAGFGGNLNRLHQIAVGIEVQVIVGLEQHKVFVHAILDIVHHEQVLGQAEQLVLAEISGHCSGSYR